MPPINIDTQLLRSFMTIADVGGFARAADALNMTQPAISQQMKRLEDLLGQPLFVRVGRGMELTGPGEILLTYAREIIELNDEIPSRMGVASVREVVTLGMPEHFSEPLLAQIIAETHRRFPHIQLLIKIGRGRFLMDNLHEGKIDISLLVGSAGALEGDLIAELPMRWLSSPDLDGEDMPDNVPLVLFRAPCGFRHAILNSLDDAHMPWRCTYEGEDLTSLKAAVKAQLGITALPILNALAGFQTPSLAKSLPRLPDAEVRVTHRAGWKSRFKDGIGQVIDDVWQTSQTNAPVRSTASAPCLTL